MGDAAVMFGAGVVFGAIATVLCLFFIAREMQSRRSNTRHGSLPTNVKAAAEALVSDTRNLERKIVLHEICRLPLCDDCKRSIG